MARLRLSLPIFRREGNKKRCNAFSTKLSINEHFFAIIRKRELDAHPVNMNSCQNCGKLNMSEAIFCRFCGTKFNFQKPVMNNPFDHAAPRPYSWKTDEFQTQNEARKTSPPQPKAAAAVSKH